VLVGRKGGCASEDGGEKFKLGARRDKKSRKGISRSHKVLRIIRIFLTRPSASSRYSDERIAYYQNYPPRESRTISSRYYKASRLTIMGL
jgi:hypothetical protein